MSGTVGEDVARSLRVMDTRRAWMAGCCLAIVLVALLAPRTAYAQASITGTVKDASGGVLPGVTVEAASPALIAKIRTAVTDGAGQFRIVDLRPGTFTLTFTLPGFNTSKRAGIELSGTFTATVDADLRVGALEETVTVTGASPIVDVQSAKRQQVITKEILDAIPSSRNPFAAATLVPGVSGGRDVGGIGAIGPTPQLQVHGGRTGDQRVLIEGLPTQSSEVTGGYSNYLVNAGSTQEMTIDIASGAAEQPTGGLILNMIPREGSNQLKGGMFASYANRDLQGSNFTARLKAAGLGTPGPIDHVYDYNPFVGVPLKRDKLWFFGAARWNGNVNGVSGQFYNKNAKNPDLWLYVPDPSRPAVTKQNQRSYNGRLTLQATPRNKVSFFYDDQTKYFDLIDGSRTPDGGLYRKNPIAGIWTLTYSSPVTNRVLLEGGFSRRIELLRYPQPDVSDPQYSMIGVVEQSTGLIYRAYDSYFHNAYGGVTHVRAATSYVTGSHALKVGFSDQSMFRNLTYNDNPYSLTYRFNNGIPNQLTQRAMPISFVDRGRAELAIYGQDKWTLGKLTLNAGLRFDLLDFYYPDQHLGPVRFAPTRNVDIPAKDWLKMKDLSPRLGAVYDLFGTGKTAVKASFNRYVEGISLGSGTFGSGTGNPLRTADTITRSWTDGNGNYVPDCDLISTAANGECGAMSNANFGKAIPIATVDPDIINGFGKRGFNWELQTGIQQQLREGLSVDLSYLRRTYGNFAVFDNRAVGPTDYSPFSIVSPVDARLPDGGGKAIAGLYDLNPNKVGQVDSYLTFAKNFGKQIERWQGVDAIVTSRMRSGLMFSGGFSTGTTLTDNCGVVTKLENPSTRFCRVSTNYLTQFKGLGSYIVPKIGVNLAVTIQSLPGPPINAIYNAPNALILSSLGRPLSGNAANATVNLVEPGTLFGERLNQIDIRFGKVVKFRTARASFNFDLYNALNSDTVVALNSNFAAWQRPQTIVLARFAKFGVQFDF